jgi:hypothetical protein
VQVLQPVIQRLVEAFAKAAEIGAMRSVSADLIAVWLFGTLQTFALLPQALDGTDSTAQSRAFTPETIANILWRGLQPDVPDRDIGIEE